MGRLACNRTIWWLQCGEHAIALMVHNQEISRFTPAKYYFVDQILDLMLDNLDLDYNYIKEIRTTPLEFQSSSRSS